MRGNNNNKDDNGVLIVKKTKKSNKKKKKRQKVGTKPVEVCKENEVKNVRKLTVKQEAFCREYLQGGSATDAYAKSYNSGGMLRATIRNRAYILLKTPPIIARLDELRQKFDAKWTASKEKTIKRLMQCQEFDIRSLYGEDGRLLMPHELSDDAARGIAGVRYDSKGNLLEYKLLDIKGCAELLGRHLRLFADKVEVDVNITHKLSDDELAQRIARIEQSVRNIAASGDVPRIASQPEIIEAEYSSCQEDDAEEGEKDCC